MTSSPRCSDRPAWRTVLVGLVDGQVHEGLPVPGPHGEQSGAFLALVHELDVEADSAVVDDGEPAVVTASSSLARKASRSTWSWAISRLSSASSRATSFIGCAARKVGHVGTSCGFRPGPRQLQLRRGPFVLLWSKTLASCPCSRARVWWVVVDLVSTPEIAELLGVSRQRVDQLSRTDDFPAPVADLAIGRVWTRDDVERWARATGRLKGDR